MANLAIDEQEVSINFLRKDELAEIYVSDNTWITKLERLCSKSPDLYKKIKETEWGNTYTFPKKLLSLRSSIITKNYTEEQLQELKERGRRLSESRNKK